MRKAAGSATPADIASVDLIQVQGGLKPALLFKNMIPKNICLECSGSIPGSLTCQDHFHTLLFWENEVPAYSEVHHLTVLCYHLQHPSLYSPEGLQAARKLLTDFLMQGVSPIEVRHQIKEQVDSGKRQAKITSRPGAQGAYSVPVHWTMTISDVVAAGKENYLSSVRDWAKSIQKGLEELPSNHEFS